uniref:Uncharacterized protein n=1 Tax=Cacopsylla melanoneura TaxID=428564 RepID=A0A8D8XXG7_9HEMI
MNKKNEMEDIEKKERKIVRRILRPRYDKGIWKLRSNKEVYAKIEKISHTMRKRRISFYAHLKRMNDTRLTKRKFDFFDKNPRTNLTWFKEVKADLKEMKIEEEIIRNRNILRQTLQEFPGFQEKKKNCGAAAWTEERREQQSERMKIYWIQRKERNRRN